MNECNLKNNGLSKTDSFFLNVTKKSRFKIESTLKHTDFISNGKLRWQIGHASMLLQDGMF